MINFDITKEEVDSILKEMILPQIIGSIASQEIKQSYILGGQPGSGKSAFARELIKINKNIVFINGDDLRAYHPKYNFYLKDNDIEAADITQAVCNFWIESLVEECIKRELDFIVEGTMRKKEVPLKTAQIAIDAGYSVNFVVISTPYELSLASLNYRYKELKRLGVPARFTKKESHDEAYQNIEETVSELVASKIFNKFFVYKRRHREFQGFVFDVNNNENIVESFKDGRVRLVEDDEKEEPISDEVVFKNLN